MHAAKQPPLRSVPRRPQTAQRRRPTHGAARQSVVLEASVKLTVNLLLAVVAGSALARLIPYYQTQSSVLKAQQEAVSVLEQEKSSLWHDFSRNFDPQQASSVMQEQSGQEPANQRTVVWINPLEEH